MHLRYKSRIVEHLKHAAYKPVVADGIADDMQIDRDEREDFRAAIDFLVDEETLERGRDNKIRLPSYPDEVEGKLRMTSRGFGFIITDKPYRDGDLFVPRGSNADAISGDRVRAKVVEQHWRNKSHPGKSPYIAKVEEVLERGQQHFVGVLAKQGKEWIVHPDGRSLNEPVVIRDPHAKNAKVGDKVVLELMHYPDGDYLAEGVIVKVLGDAGRPDVETAAVIAAHGLREEFADSVVDEARDATRAFEEASEGPWPGREDLTERLIFTIDPPDARDFDDAISIVHNADDDEWELGVHIADVGHFVRAGSELDREATARGNSVYLPRHVIPMLPELLSNGVCSLQEGVIRFAKSVFITFDGRGKVMHQRVAATVIRSRRRMTYLEAQAVIDGDLKVARRHARTDPDYPDDLVEAVRNSDKLARILRKRRRKDGMIVLNLPEVELVFDDDGHVVDAVPEDDAFTHTLIEMFMVEANEAIGRLFSGMHVPVLRRIHPEPVAGDITELQLYALLAGERLPDNPDRRDLQKLLEATTDTPASRAIHFAVLRTLTKASYSPALVGHYALASPHYAHFTSPIRRYPDLQVHRALEAWLEITDNGKSVPGGRKRDGLVKRLLDDERVPDEGQLIELGQHCSETEVAATEAERELRGFLVMQFLHDNHLGEEFDGIVTGITGGGVFVSIERFLAEGLVKREDLPSGGGRSDRWDIDERTGRLTARRSGRSIGAGDRVRVKIVAVDLASRHLDLLITEVADAPQALIDQANRRPRSGGKGGKGKGGRGKSHKGSKNKSKSKGRGKRR